MNSPHSDFTVAVVMADIALVLLVGAVLVKLARLMRQPPVIGEIVAGIMLGPSLLGLLPGDLTETIFPADVRPHLAMIAQVGLLLFMFGVGWEFNAGLLRKRSGAVVSVSLTAVALSFALGLAVASVLYGRHDVVGGERIPLTAFAVYLGVAMSITAFPVLARILADGGLQHTQVGALVLASAAIDDVLAWCLLAVVVALVTATATGMLIGVVAYTVLYALVMAAVVRPLLARLVARLTRDGDAAASLLAVIAAGVFLSAFATSWIGIHVIFGAFAFGLIMPREPREVLGRCLREPMENASRVLLPIFFIVTGLSVDIGALGGTGVAELLLICAAACLGKLLGAAVPARLAGFCWRDAYAVGLLMNTRGLTELVILNVGVSLGILDTRMFTMMVLMALVTTAMAAPLLPGGLARAAAVPATGHGGSHPVGGTAAA